MQPLHHGTRATLRDAGVGWLVCPRWRVLVSRTSTPCITVENGRGRGARGHHAGRVSPTVPGHVADAASLDDVPCAVVRDVLDPCGASYSHLSICVPEHDVPPLS